MPVAARTLAGIAEVQQEDSPGRPGGRPHHFATVTPDSEISYNLHPAEGASASEAQFLPKDRPGANNFELWLKS